MEKVFVVTCLEHQRDKAAAFGVEGVADCKEGVGLILDALFNRKCDVYNVRELNGHEHYTEGESFLIGGQDFACIGCIREVLVTRSQMFPVSYVTREDIDLKGFDASNIDDDTMEGIASQMDIYACESVGYWEALEGACKDYEIPRKED